MTAHARTHDPLLVVSGISKTFEGIRGRRATAVTDVSFEVHAGEGIGLVGRSGAGKSTLARIVAGIVTPDTGVVRFDGHEMGRMPGRARRRLQADLHLLFQDPYTSLAPGMSAAELIAEPLRIHRRGSLTARRAAALTALEEVGLHPVESYASRYPHELSGGERQRVAIARALVMRPQLMIADEPTQMLDTALRGELIDLLAELRERHHMAQLYITHDLALAARSCERVLVMDAGAIVEQGSAAAVFGAPRHPQTVELVHAVRRLQSALPKSSRTMPSSL